MVEEEVLGLIKVGVQEEEEDLMAVLLACRVTVLVVILVKLLWMKCGLLPPVQILGSVQDGKCKMGFSFQPLEPLVITFMIFGQIYQKVNELLLVNNTVQNSIRFREFLISTLQQSLAEPRGLILLLNGEILHGHHTNLGMQPIREALEESWDQQVQQGQMEQMAVLAILEEQLEHMQ